MAAQYDIAIVIVSYRVKFFIEQCLHSIAMASLQLKVQTIVVDNAGNDDSIGYLKALFPHTVFIQNEENIGFGGACNIGVKHSNAQLVLFLNPDTLITPNSLLDIQQVFNSMPQVGAVGNYMVDGSGTYLPESKRGYPSLATSVYKMLGLAKAFPTSKRLARYYLGHLPANQNCAVEVLAGACLTVRSLVLAQVGGFDEVFFMYGEDIDLSYRIKAAGWQNYYLASSPIVHFKGESTSKQSAKYIPMFYGAMRLFVRKHYPKWQATIYSILIKQAALLAKAKQKLLPQENKPTTQTSYEAIWVVSYTHELPSTAAAILQKHAPHKPIKILTPNKLLELLSSSTAPVAVLFCIDEKLRIDACIALLEPKHSHCLYLFYHVDSGSIIGSSSRLVNGIAWG